MSDTTCALCQHDHICTRVLTPNLWEWVCYDCKTYGACSSGVTYAMLTGEPVGIEDELVRDHYDY